MPDPPDEIPLFPLPNVVLYPLVSVPLYIFEPRYRQLVKDANDGARRIGMVAVPAEHRADMLGDPPVYPTGCEGEIVHCAERPDGTFNLVLRATGRFRIVSEMLPMGECTYRRALIERLEDGCSEDEQAMLQTGRNELFVLLSEVVKRAAPQHARHFGSDRFKEIEDEQLVNALAQALELEVKDKQQLLEIDSVRSRQRMLCELMRFRIAELDGSSALGTGTVH